LNPENRNRATTITPRRGLVCTWWNKRNALQEFASIRFPLIGVTLIAYLISWNGTSTLRTRTHQSPPLREEPEPRVGLHEAPPKIARRQEERHREALHLLPGETVGRGSRHHPFHPADDTEGRQSTRDGAGSAPGNSGDGAKTKCSFTSGYSASHFPAPTPRTRARIHLKRKHGDSAEGLA